MLLFHQRLFVQPLFISLLLTLGDPSGQPLVISGLSFSFTLILVFNVDVFPILAVQKVSKAAKDDQKQQNENSRALPL